MNGYSDKDAIDREIRKVAIIGYSGCGKSTLAAYLGEKLGIDVLYIDTIQFAPGWVERPLDIKKEMMQRFLENHAAGWVIDGNYTRLSFDKRMEDADLIIVMTFNRISCLLRVIKRYSENKGRSRASMTAGCDEKLDAEFVKWILWKGRKSNKPMIARVSEQYPEKVVKIGNQQELNRFYKRIASEVSVREPFAPESAVSEVSVREPFAPESAASEVSAREPFAPESAASEEREN